MSTPKPKSKPERGRSRRLDPKSVMTQGCDFEYALRLLYDHLARKDEEMGTSGPHYRPIPALCVLEAFATELYLKTLAVMERKTCKKTHLLRSLFADLRHKTRDEIRAMYDKWLVAVGGLTHYADQAGRTVKADFDHVLRRNSRAFERWRYGYECRRLEWTGTPITRIVRTIIQQRRPDLCEAMKYLPRFEPA